MNKKWTTARVAVSLAVGALALDGAAAQAQAQYTLKIGAITVRDPLHQYMDEYKKRIEERSGGRIEARVYPAAQLGDIFRMIEGLQLGTIEMLVSATGFYKSIHPGFQVGDAPGVFADLSHGQRVFADPAFRSRFISLGEPKNVAGIGLWVYGPSVIVSTKPLRSIGDFKGKKIRVLASKIEIDAMSKLAGTGVPLPLSEALPALQNGVIDAANGATLVFAGFKYHTTAKYLTALDAMYIPVVSTLSVEWRKKLPADLSRAVVDVGNELDDWANKTAEAADKNAEKLWQDNGGEVIRFAADERAEVRRRFASIGDDVLGGDPATKELWALLKDLAAKHK
jgi:C4-dicarboxylate-binding protein DctP